MNNLSGCCDINFCILFTYFLYINKSVNDFLVSKANSLMKRYFILMLVKTLLIQGEMNCQVFEFSKLYLLLYASRNDSVLKIEREAALKFHQIINEYRSKNHSGKLGWDDTLWLTCRNHNIWMNSISRLSHIEEEGTKNFTGKDPGERYAFTANFSGYCRWNGENALYNWNKNGNTISEISSNMAKSAFTQWKQSPGHNQNMLAKSSRVHGVSFYLGTDGKVWATDLFGYVLTTKLFFQKKDADLPKDASASLASSLTNSDPVQLKLCKFKKADINKTIGLLLTALYNKFGSKQELLHLKSRWMETAATHHAEYILYTKKVNGFELKGKSKYYGRTEKKRWIRASLGLCLFKLVNNKMFEKNTTIETEISTLNIDSLSNKIHQKLNSDENQEDPVSGIGYGIAMKRIKNSLQIFVTEIISRKKNKKPVLSEKEIVSK